MPRSSNQGGAGHNQGRKPGRPELGNAGLGTLILEDSDTRASPQIPAYVLSAGAFYARGLSYSEIGRRMGKTRDTVSGWLQRYPEAAESAVRELTDPADALRRLIPASISAYESILERGSKDSDRLRAADAIMDRVYGKPVVRTESSARPPIRIRFVTLGPAALDVVMSTDPDQPPD